MRRVIGVVLRGRDLGRDFFPFRFITPGEYPRCREYRAPMISWIIRGFESFFPLFLLFPFPIFPPFVSSLRSLIFIAHQLSFNSHRYLGHVHFWTDFLCTNVVNKRVVRGKDDDLL